MTVPDLFERARSFADDPAIVDLDAGTSHTYGELMAAAGRVAATLAAARADGGRATDLDGARVAFLVPPSFDYAAVMWGIWLSGGVAVPLALAHPRRELEYALDDCGAACAVAAPGLAPLAAERGIAFMATEDLVGTGGPASESLPALTSSSRP